MIDELFGKQFGNLVVGERVDDYVSPSGGKHKKYKCTCSCGNSKYVLLEHLTSGRTQSCGCLKKSNGHPKHRQIHTRLYRVWGNMINRCSNPNNPAWERYGGRGITVCDSWKDFEIFKAWAESNGYSDTLSIDRIDNNKGYNPENCRWVDDVTQNNNRRNNVVITYNNQSHTISEWSKLLNIPYKVLYARLVSRNWEIERAFNQALR